METGALRQDRLPILVAENQPAHNKSFFIAGWIQPKKIARKLRNRSQDTADSQSRSGRSRSSSILKRNGVPAADVEYKSKQITYQAYFGQKNLAGQPYFGESAGEQSEEYHVRNNTGSSLHGASKKSRGHTGEQTGHVTSSGVGRDIKQSQQSGQKRDVRAKLPLTVDLAVSGEEG